MKLIPLTSNKIFKAFIFLFFIILLTLFSCKNQESTNSIPISISKQIRIFSAESTCRDAKVNEFKYQDKLVYVFEEGTCRYDKEINVCDHKGKLLGSLGGFVGNTMINGEDFNSAVFQRTIWQKE